MFDGVLNKRKGWCSGLAADRVSSMRILVSAYKLEAIREVKKKRKRKGKNYECVWKEKREVYISVKFRALVLKGQSRRLPLLAFAYVALSHCSM
jgi:hypothetical protein